MIQLLFALLKFTLSIDCAAKYPRIISEGEFMTVATSVVSINNAYYVSMIEDDEEFTYMVKFPMDEEEPELAVKYLAVTVLMDCQSHQSQIKCFMEASTYIGVAIIDQTTLAISGEMTFRRKAMKNQIEQFNTFLEINSNNQLFLVHATNLSVSALGIISATSTI